MYNVFGKIYSLVVYKELTIECSEECLLVESYVVLSKVNIILLVQSQYLVISLTS